MAHSQEATQLYVDLAKLKIKWAELHDAVNLVAERSFRVLQNFKGR